MLDLNDRVKKAFMKSEKHMPELDVLDLDYEERSRFNLEPSSENQNNNDLYNKEIQKAYIDLELQLGHDFLFLLQSKDADKPITSLESVDTQVLLLKKMHKESKKPISPSIEINNLKKMMSALKNSDFQEFSKASVEDFSIQDPKLMRVMHDDRNKAMISKILPELGDEKPFIFVGAHHLVGENGLVNLLSKEGWAMKQVLKRMN
jgi:uncharacterized protein YbaP (TraB family)